MYTEEMVRMAKEAADAGELLAMAQEHGIDMTAEEAAEKFALLHSEMGEISDDELDNVAGGGCGKKNDNKPASLYNVGDSVYIISLKNSKYITRYAGTVVSKKYTSNKWIYGVDRGVGEEFYEEQELGKN